MMLYGKIIVIKRSGADGAHFPLTTSNCLFGRSNDCDIRIQLPNVSREHCRITVADTGEVLLTNLSAVNPITVNSKHIETSLLLSHGDVFTIIDRSFRFETVSGKSPVKSPGKTTKNNVLTPLKGSPKTPKNIDMNETRPLSPKKTPRNMTPQPSKIVKSITPRHNSSPADMKQAAKILTPKAKPPLASDESGKAKQRVQSPSPVRNTPFKNHVSRVDGQVTKSPVKTSGKPAKTPSRKENKSISGTKSPAQKNMTPYAKTPKSPARSPLTAIEKLSEAPVVKTPAKSPGRPKSPGNKTPVVKTPGRPKSAAKTPVAKTPAKSPGRPKSPVAKTPAVKTPAKSPGRPKSPAAKTPAVKTPAKSPGRPKSPVAKTPAVKTPAKSPGRPKSPAVKTPVVKTPAKSPGRSPSPAAKTPAVKTPAKSPGRPKSPAAKTPAVKTPAKSPGRSPSPAAKTPAVKTPAKSPGRSPSPAAKTPAVKTSAKSPGRSPSPAAKTPAVKTPVKSPGRPKSPATLTPLVKTPAKSPAAKTPSVKTSGKSPGRPKSPAMNASIIETPAKSPGRPKSPAAKSPAKSPGRPKSPATRSPISETQALPATELPVDKSPAKSPGRPKSPATKTPVAKSPAKSPGRPKSPAAKTPDVKTPAKSPGRSLSPATKTPVVKSPAKSPGRPKSPASKSPVIKSPAKSPGRPKSPGRSPSPVKSAGRSPKSPVQKTAKSPVKPPMSPEEVSLPATESGKKTPSPKQVKRKTLPADSPYIKPTENLKSGLSDIRRKSQPKIKESPAGLGMKRSGEKRKSTDNIAPSAKKKRISFGPQLSPEMFDKKLPPMTPVRRGTAPRRLSEPIQIDSPKSLLKRKSIAVVSKESTIVEESPRKESPVKVTPGKKSPKSTKSPKSVGKKSPKKSDKRSSRASELNISYSGIEEMMKTPTVATSTPKSKMSGKKNQRASTGSLIGVKNLLKTPKGNAADVSFTGVSAMMTTPESDANLKKASMKKSPKRTPTPRKSPKLLKKTPKSAKQSPPLKNAVAMRAIHGKARTPKLPTNLWSDIVKKGIAEKGIAKRVSPGKPVVLVSKKGRTPKSAKKVPPKTPRTKAAYLAPTTGHIASPATIVIRKKLTATPGPLPRKGRKSIGIKKSKKQTQAARLSGVADMFQTPSPAASPMTSNTSLSLYSDLPETPTGPGEMMVSPLVASKRKSVPTPKMSGLKTLFAQPKRKSDAKLGGIKQLLATPKQKLTAASPTGVKELFQTPKSSSKSTVKKSATKKSAAKAKKPPTLKKSPAKVASPLVRRGRKRVAPSSPEVMEIIEEAPAKRARRGAVKKTPKKTPVKASPVQEREIVTVTTETTVQSTQASPPKPRGRRALKASPKAVQKSPVQKNARRKGALKNDGKPKTPPKMAKTSDESKVDTNLTESKSTKKSPAKKATRGSRRKVVSPRKAATPIKTQDNSGKEDNEKNITTDSKTPVKKVTRGSRRKAVTSSKKATPNKMTKVDEEKTNNVASPAKPVGRGKRKRVESEAESSSKDIQDNEPTTPVAKRSRGRGKQPVVKSPKSVKKSKSATPVKKSTQKKTRGRVVKDVLESTSQKLPSVPGRKKKTDASVEKVDSPLPVVSPKKSRRGLKMSSPKKSPVGKKVASPVPVVSAKKSRRGLKISSPKPVSKVGKKADLDQSLAVVVTPVTKKTAAAKIRKGRNANQSVQIEELTLESKQTAKKAASPANRGRKRKAPSPVKAPAAAEPKNDIENVEQPAKRGRAKGVKKTLNKTTPVKKTSTSPSPAKITKKTKKTVITPVKAVSPSPAKVTKRGTRNNPNPKTPVKGKEAKKQASPKPSKNSKKVPKASPQKKSPVKRVTRARK